MKRAAGQRRRRHNIGAATTRQRIAGHDVGAATTRQRIHRYGVSAAATGQRANRNAVGAATAGDGNLSAAVSRLRSDKYRQSGENEECQQCFFHRLKLYHGRLIFVKLNAA